MTKLFLSSVFVAILVLPDRGESSRNLKGRGMGMNKGMMAMGGMGSSKISKGSKSSKSSKSSAGPLDSICRTIGGTVEEYDNSPSNPDNQSGSNGSNPFEDTILAAQPNCQVTCDDRADKYFLEITGLKDSIFNEPNTVALDESASPEELKRLISTMSPLKVATKEQRECILNPERHLNELLPGRRPYIYYASVNINASELQFGPPRDKPCDRYVFSYFVF